MKKRTIETAVGQQTVAGGLLSVASLLLVSGFPLHAVDFATDIRPILSENCFHCHGPDEEDRKAGLRLDTREGAIEDLGGYQAIKPGSPVSSELYKRITTEDTDDLMPPPSTGKKLTSEQVVLIRKWIEEGAERGSHWAFEPPTRPNTPSVKRKEWIQNPIDRFVLARLEEQGLAPSPKADKVKLLRRLHLDLTGLPPTLEEIDSFLADKDPLAIERRVDDLLKSPHYGERWDATGWTQRVMLIPTDSKRTNLARSGSTGTGWSTPSTRTCPTTSSSSSRSRATSFPDPHRARRWPQAFSAIR